jgi:isopenicillin-N N-acyltransferase like protein
MYERIVVEGGPRERGVQYGQQTRRRVELSIDGYRAIFQANADWSWDQVCEHAELYRQPIADYNPRYLDEIAGIAEGAGVDEIEILAINVRTEVMFAADARDAAQQGRRPSECTSFALMPERAADGRMLIGQTWDWLSHSVETVVILEAHQDDGPDYVTVVEAGLLAKTGMNSAGIGLAANALVSSADVGEPGVPYHVLLRAIFDSETMSDALVALERSRRSSSGNFLIGDQDGLAINIEAAPGDYSQLFLGYPQDGLITHTNHFTCAGFTGQDVAVHAMPDSPFRLQRFGQLVKMNEGPFDRAFFESVLADHATFPLGICAHPDPRVEPLQQYETVAALIMDIAARRMWLASGRPCVAPFELLDLGEVLSKRSPIREATAS